MTWLVQCLAARVLQCIVSQSLLNDVSVSSCLSLILNVLARFMSLSRRKYLDSITDKHAIPTVGTHTGNESHVLK